MNGIYKVLYFIYFSNKKWQIKSLKVLYFKLNKIFFEN